LPLDGDEWSATGSDRFIPGKDPGNHCVGYWMGTRAGLDDKVVPVL